MITALRLLMVASSSRSHHDQQPGSVSTGHSHCNLTFQSQAASQENPEPPPIGGLGVLFSLRGTSVGNSIKPSGMFLGLHARVRRFSSPSSSCPPSTASSLCNLCTCKPFLPHAGGFLHHASALQQRPAQTTSGPYLRKVLQQTGQTTLVHTSAGVRTREPGQQTSLQQSDDPDHTPLAALLQQGRLQEAHEMIRWGPPEEHGHVPTELFHSAISSLCQAQRTQVRAISLVLSFASLHQLIDVVILLWSLQFCGIVKRTATAHAHTRIPCGRGPFRIST